MTWYKRSLYFIGFSLLSLLVICRM